MGKDLRQRATAEPAQQGDNKKPATLAQQIDRMEPEFQRAMPQGAEARQLVRDAQTALRQVKDLAKCEPSTVLGALMTCSQLGLRPGVLGQAYVLPFWDNKDKVHKAQLVIGYKGMLSLVYRSGLVETIAARIVYANDEFLLEYGLGEDTLIHRPPAGFADRGEPVAYYAIARMKGGGYAITDPIGVEAMRKHRDKNSKAAKFGPWRDHFDQMALKTMIRKLANTLPQSTEIQQAIMHDGAVRADTTPAAVDQTPAYVDAEFSEGEESTPVNEPADNPPAAADGQTGQDMRDIVAIELDKRAISAPDDVAAFLQQTLIDPDAPKTVGELTDAQAREILSNISDQ